MYPLVTGMFFNNSAPHSARYFFIGCLGNSTNLHLLSSEISAVLCNLLHFGHTAYVFAFFSICNNSLHCEMKKKNYEISLDQYLLTLDQKIELRNLLQHQISETLIDIYIDRKSV